MNPVSLGIADVALPALGFIVGGLIGATGVGAGSLTTPMLVLGFGVPPVIAVGTDLLFATATKLIGAIAHRKLGSIDTRILLWLAAGSLPMAMVTLSLLAGSHVQTETLARLIKTLLGVVLCITVVALVARPYIAAWLRRGKSPDAKTRPTPQPRLIAIGGLLGGLVALTSIGAGALGVVALALASPGLGTRRIIGTDIAHAIPLTLVCGAGHLALGHTDFKLLGMLLIGSLPGVWLGSHWSIRFSEPAMRLLLAAVLSVSAFMLLRS